MAYEGKCLTSYEIIAYLGLGLDQEERRKMLEHLKLCGSCDLALMEENLSQLGKLPDPNPPDIDIL